MSVYVIANCNIEITEGELQTDEQKAGLKKIIEDGGGSSVNIYVNSADWGLSGNHAVDYSVMDNVKDFLNKIGVKFEINSNEFAEAGNGYWFDSDEEN